jgi:hypothetical protein
LNFFLPLDFYFGLKPITPIVMRKLDLLFLCLVALFMLAITACNEDADKVANPCEESQQTEITRSFVISAKVMYDDQTPYEGDIHFFIKKEYCDGTISGEYTLDHIPTSSQGDWFSGMVYTYKFANTQDKVIVKFTWATDNKTYYEYWDELKYNNVVGMGTQSEIQYEITLPWSEK